MSLTPLKVADLAGKLSITTPGAIKHIKILEKAGLVKGKVDPHVAGKPKTIYPAEKIFTPGVQLPFLLDVFPNYLFAIETIGIYERTAVMNPPSNKAINAIEENTHRLEAEENKLHNSDAVYGWLAQAQVLLEWCYIFLMHFVEKIGRAHV